MFNNYYNNYTRFTSISNGRLPPKAAKLDIKFYRTEILTII